MRLLLGLGQGAKKQARKQQLMPHIRAISVLIPCEAGPPNGNIFFPTFLEQKCNSRSTQSQVQIAVQHCEFILTTPCRPVSGLRAPAPFGWPLRQAVTALPLTRRRRVEIHGCQKGFARNAVHSKIDQLPAAEWLSKRTGCSTSVDQQALQRIRRFWHIWEMVSLSMCTPMCEFWGSAIFFF